MSTSTSTARPIGNRPVGAPRRHLIDGEWVPSLSGATFKTIDPSTGIPLAEIAEGGAADVDRAVAAARRALDGPWARYTPAQREDVLLRLADKLDAHFDELRDLDVHEMGMPIGPGQEELRAWTREVVRYYAGWPTKVHGDTIEVSAPGNPLVYTRKEPVGVVAAIMPWNGPMIGTLYKIAPVLASGCTVILKPAEEASLSPLRIGELIGELDIPPGVINIVTGDAVVGEALTSHPDVDKIAFTGSYVTGQHIIRAATGNLKRVTLELGGKSPDILFADADLDRAVPGAAIGAFFNTGQACVAGSRIFVERPIYEEFLERIADFAASLKVGVSDDPATVLGPIISQAQLDRVGSYLKIGAEEGARAVTGGEVLSDADLAGGYFVQPTVFADVQDDMRIAREEIFGPVAAVMPFDDVDEVIRRANDTSYGLAGGLWTRDVARAHRVAAAIKSGTVWVNTYLPMDIAAPFGGYKMSGWGREGGREGLDEYFNVKTIWVDIS